MNQTIPRRLFGVLLLSAVCVTPCVARTFELWSYEKLAAESDIVAIVEPIENKPAQDIFPGYSYGHPRDHFAATDTLFKVHTVFKGRATNDLTLLHFSYSTNVTIILDGAFFIRFLNGQVTSEKGVVTDGKPVGGDAASLQPRVWIAFFKRRGDGRCDPVTGCYDSALSFRELREPPFLFK